ncbi:MAG TPA: hypothetical protein VN806_09435 [Caulobacteraceae bacterium]|nr:hypothetical protein [Caulobacteraceae bacterium]
MALPAAILIATAALGGAVHAGPTGARAPTVAAVQCTAPAPERGAAFSGPVLQVIDGRSLCVAEGPTPASWVRVTLAGAPDRGDRSDLMTAAFARRVTCVVDQRNEDGVLARCTIDEAAGAAIDRTPASLTSLEPNAATCLRPD